MNQKKNYVENNRDVLDYRKWFQFKLFFKRNNGDKRELTDKEFSKFSGGEKAIAMYIPLFAGINAKFNSAKKDAPRIVALDEAFAGVDDINIEDSFRILDELNLDYVLTSQILWGDYSTIKSLSICELHHLSSSDVVSVLRYKWDGHKRLLIMMKVSIKIELEYFENKNLKQLFDALKEKYYKTSKLSGTIKIIPKTKEEVIEIEKLIRNG